MQKIISDPGFAKYLEDGGGLSDLHPDIAHVVYAAFSSGLIHTKWSWAGTVGKHIDGLSTGHPELVLYQLGGLAFSPKPSDDTAKDITDRILKIPNSNHFSQIKPWSENAHFLTLEMDDLTAEHIHPYRDYPSIKYSLIREADGIARYGEFMSVWNSIYQLLLPHARQEHRANLEIIAKDVAANSQYPFPRRIFCDYTKGQFQQPNFNQNL